MADSLITPEEALRVMNDYRFDYIRRVAPRMYVVGIANKVAFFANDEPTAIEALAWAKRMFDHWDEEKGSANRG